MKNNAQAQVNTGLPGKPGIAVSALTKIFVRSAVFLAIVFIGAAGAEAATHYVRAGASGSANGSDWTNAYTNLPSTLVRGDTYYVASGSYGTYSFASTSGTSMITIKKATVADSGTSTGWSDSYASGQAIWTRWNFSMSYLTIDGQTGGGPGSWSSGHGIAVRALADHLIYGNSSVSNITLRHVELDGTSTASADRDIVYLISGFSNLTMQYVYIHDVGCDIFQIRGNASNFTLEYSFVGRNNQDAACHGDVFEYDGGTASNWLHRYNWFDECQGTYLWGTHEAGTFSNAEIYGNIVSGGKMDNGMIAGLSGGGTVTGLKFYNNTIANVTTINAGFYYLERGTNNQVYNNIWYNSPANMGGTTHDYNWFYGSGSQSESHIQSGSGNPFVNISADNYNLAAATNAGMTLGSPYNLDMAGKTRGSNGVWDRGGLEFGSNVAVSRPSAPFNLSIY